MDGRLALDGYRETAVAASSDVFEAGSTSYDANGFLTGVTDATKAANSRTFVNDASGTALLVNQNGMAERQLVVNGEVMGRYGVGLNEVTPRSGDGDPNFAKASPTSTSATSRSTATTRAPVLFTNFKELVTLADFAGAFERPA